MGSILISTVNELSFGEKSQQSRDSKPNPGPLGEKRARTLPLCFAAPTPWVLSLIIIFPSFIGRFSFYEVSLGGAFSKSC